MSNEQKQFPYSTIEITAKGMILTTYIAPGLSQMQSIGEELMNKICTQWVETRRDILKQLQVIGKES